jgi:hypothetical protein
MRGLENQGGKVKILCFTDGMATLIVSDTVALRL